MSAALLNSNSPALSAKKLHMIPVRAIAVMASLALGACETSNLGLSSDANNTAQQVNQAAVAMTPNPQGEVVGQGNVRVALMLPSSAPGNFSRIAQEVKNASLMAMNDFGNNVIQLVIKDNAGQATASQDKAAEAIKEGASAIIGPMLAGNVSAASGITQPAGRTIIAFSSDNSIARRGVYLLSYTPQEDVTRIASYAISQGKRSFLAFLPANAEGSVREATLKQVAGAAGASVQVIKYQRSAAGIASAAKLGAASVAMADTIYIPESGKIPATILNTIKSSGGNVNGKTILGSGRWESIQAGDPVLTGAIYPGRDVTRFAQFANRYKASYGKEPSVYAAIGYDAVTLVSELVRQNGANAFSSPVLENKRGFAGINGIFRMRSNGTTQHGLAIYQIVNGRGQLAVPAPTSFGASGS